MRQAATRREINPANCTVLCQSFVSEVGSWRILWTAKVNPIRSTFTLSTVYILYTAYTYTLSTYSHASCDPTHSPDCELPMLDSSWSLTTWSWAKLHAQFLRWRKASCHVVPVFKTYIAGFWNILVRYNIYIYIEISFSQDLSPLTFNIPSFRTSL